MFSGNMGADVVEQEASKAEGLKRLCQYYDIGLGADSGLWRQHE